MDIKKVEKVCSLIREISVTFVMIAMCSVFLFAVAYFIFACMMGV